MKTIRKTFTFYRHQANDVSHIFDDGCSRRGIFREFVETWERDYGDENSLTKRRISQVATGRAFRFFDHVTPEYLEDNPYEKSFSKRYLVLMLLKDFTFLRLKRV